MRIVADYQSKMILNGLRLSEKSSANVFHEMFTNKNKSPAILW